MDFLSFNIVTGYLAAFSGLFFAIAILLRTNSKVVQTYLALMILSLSFASGFRSVAWATGSTIYLSTAYLFFSLFPLFFALLVESLTQEKLSVIYKAPLLFFTTFFAGTSWIVSVRNNPAWILSLMILQISSISYVFVILWRERAINLLRKKERHMLYTIFYGISFGFIVMGLEWFYTGSTRETARVTISSITLLILIHAIANIYFKAHVFKFKDYARTLTAFLIFSFAASQILFIGGAAIIIESQHYLTTGLLFACALSFSAIQLQMSRALRRDLEHITQLVHVSKKSVPQFLKEFAKNPGLQKVTIATKHEVESLDCTDAYSSLSSGLILNRQSIKLKLRSKNLPAEQLKSLKALSTLLQIKKANCVLAIGTTGDLLLANPTPFTSIEHLNGLLIWAAENLNFIIEGQNNLSSISSLKPTDIYNPPESFTPKT